MNNTSLPPVLWKPVLGLAAVQAAITLMWVIYGAYLPELLGQLGMPAAIAGVLLVVENGIAVVTHPLMGSLSDRTLHQVSTRFPVIAIGVLLASAFFLVIPMLGRWGGSDEQGWGVTLFVLVSWATAMTVFQSPVMSLLGKYAAVPQLPLASGLLTLTLSLVGTARAGVNQAILSLGPIVTFLIGSIVLVGAAYALRVVDPPDTPVMPPENGKFPSLGVSLGLIAAVGIGVGTGSRWVMDVLGKVFSSQIAPEATANLMLAVSIGLALLALPAGWLATQWGNRRLMAIALLLAILLPFLLLHSPHRWVLGSGVLLLIGALSLIFNGAFPFALSLVPPLRGGVAIGMYLGGSMAAVTGIGILFPDTGPVPMTHAAWMESIGFTVALLGILVSYKVWPSISK